MACVDEPPSSPGGAFNSNITHGFALERQRHEFAQSLVIVFTSHHSILAMRDGLVNSINQSQLLQSSRSPGLTKNV
jgi:hypothetical protein